MNSEQAKAHEIEASGSRDEPASPPQDEVTELAQAQEKHDDKTEPAAELENQDDEAVAHSSESENAASTTAGVHKGQDGWTAVWDPSYERRMLFCFSELSLNYMFSLQKQCLLLLQREHWRHHMGKPSEHARGIDFHRGCF